MSDTTASSTSAVLQDTIDLQGIEKLVKDLYPLAPEVRIFESPFLMESVPQTVRRSWWERLKEKPLIPNKVIMVQVPSSKCITIDHSKLGQGNFIGVYCHPAAAYQLRRMIRELSDERPPQV